MVSFPKPTGVAQLVYNHKQAWILDPHVQSKVLLTAEAPEAGWLGSDGVKKVESDDRRWKLEFAGNTCYVSFDDGIARGFWRRELCPEENDPLHYVQLKKFRPQSRFNPLIIAITFALLFLFLMATLQFNDIHAFKEDLRKTKTEIDTLLREEKDHSAKLLRRTEDLFEHTHALFRLEQRAFREEYEKAHSKVLDEVKKPASEPVQQQQPFDKDIPNSAKLLPGEKMLHDTHRTNGFFKLSNSHCSLSVFDANMVETRYIVPAVAGLVGKKACALAVQYDGNLVMYETDSGNAVWSSKDTRLGICRQGFYLSERGTLASFCEQK